MPSDTVLCERDGPVAIVRLNRPEKRNAMNREMTDALLETIEALDQDDSVAAIVLTGAGDKAFTAGADMSEQALDRPRVDGTPPPSRGFGATDAILRTGKPVIAAINGFAFGGGAWLATVCDFRYASTTASFRFVGASYGLVVGGDVLPRIVGPAHAKELLFTTKVIDAQEAQRIGLVNRVYEPDELMPAALETAKQIAGNSAGAVQWIKRVVDASTVIEAGKQAQAESDRALRGTDEQTSRFREAAKRVTGQS